MSEDKPNRQSTSERVRERTADERDIERMFEVVLDICARDFGAAALFTVSGRDLAGWRLSDGERRAVISGWSIPRQTTELYEKILCLKPFVAPPETDSAEPDGFTMSRDGKPVRDWRVSALGGFGDSGKGGILFLPWALAGKLGGLFLFARRGESAPGGDGPTIAEAGRIAAIVEQNVLRLYKAEHQPAGQAPAPPKKRQDAEPLESASGGPAPASDAVSPKGLARLIEAGAEGRAPVSDLKSVIAADPSLKARVLKLASSPYYCGGVEAQTLDEAAVLLGGDALCGAVLAAKLRGTYLGGTETPVRARLWRHALACASLSRIIVRHTNACEESYAFAAGLLHDVGRLLLATERPEDFRRWLAGSCRDSGSIIAGEMEIFGCSHIEIGVKWAMEQGLPEAVVSAIEGHHSSETGGEASVIAAAVEFANTICRHHEIGLIYRPDIRPDRHVSWRRLDLPEDVYFDIEQELPLILAAESLCL